VLHKTGGIGREDHAPIPRASSGEHRVVIQVTQNDPAVMNMALNNAQNLRKYYAEQGKSVRIEFVAYGPGLQMLREDISPVKDRIESFAMLADVTFSACGNTMSAQSRNENKDITLISNARVVPAGIARIVELQEQGWSYVRP
jgi:intracellular sulfur oxidation DsrE/DsrF family protein